MSLTVVVVLCVLTLTAVGCSALVVRERVATSDEGTVAGATDLPKAIPPIDAAAPQQTETATFALG